MLALTKPLPFLPSAPVLWSIVGGVLFSLVGLKWLLSRPRKVRPVHEAGSVIGIVGRKGAGKSYLAVKLAREQLVAGAHVCSNFTMYMDKIGPHHGNWKQFSGWGQFIHLHGDFWCPACGVETHVLYEPDHCKPLDCHQCGRRSKVKRRLVVIIDEVQGWAPSMERQKLPKPVTRAMANGRKLGVDLYWLSQHENRVSTALKYDTNEIYVCRRNGTTFRATAYEPEYVRKRDKSLFEMKYELDLGIAELYDTLEILELGGSLPDSVTGENAPEGAVRRSGAPTPLRSRWHPPGMTG